MCNAATEKYFNEKCDEIERTQGSSPKDTQGRIRETTGKHKATVIMCTGCIKSKQGSLIVDEEEIIGRW